MKSIEEAFDSSRALVFGIGGGGDVVGAIPTARLLEEQGVETYVGGLAWERIVNDPVPGPRDIDQLENVHKVSNAVALGDSRSQTTDGIEFAETKVSRVLERDVALLDITGGVTGLRDGLSKACDELEIDLVIGTDSGGDVLATGEEDGIVSPLADGVVLAALAQLNVPTCLGMFGYGSDGELTRQELHENIGSIAKDGGLLGAWGLTSNIGDELERVLEVVNTDASRLPVRVSRGDVVEHPIRGGKRSVQLTPASTVTFYFDPKTVRDHSRLAEIVEDTDSIESANRRLTQAGYDTELSYEREHPEARSTP